MKKEEAKYYAEKYRRTQKKLAIGVSIFICIISVILVIGAIIIFINAQKTEDKLMLNIVASVMVTLAVVDIYLAYRFFKYSKKHFKYMNDYEAAEHYCKIHGFDRVNPPKIPEDKK